MNTVSTSSRLPAWLEQAWLERYLDRLLTDEEAAWFETYVLDKPELLAQIDADSTLRDAFAVEGSRGGAASANVVSMAPRQRRSARRAMPVWFAAAAALVVGIGIGAMYQRSVRYRVTPGIITNPTRMVFDTMRGTQGDRRVEHRDSDSTYVLIEAAVPPDATDIAVEVAGLTRRGLSVSPDGFVSFLVSADVKETARTAVLSYQSRGSRVTQSLDLQLSGGKANE